MALSNMTSKNTVKFQLTQLGMVLAKCHVFQKLIRAVKKLKGFN